MISFRIKIIFMISKETKHSEIFYDQVEFHPYLVRQNLLDHAIMNDYLLMAYSPVAKGRLIKDAFMRDIGRDHGKSPTQVALRWLVQEGIVPVPKASNPKHLQENTDIFNFSLSDEEMAAIRALDRELHLDPVSDMAYEE